jgi:hypothetical protein
MQRRRFAVLPILLAALSGAHPVGAQPRIAADPRIELLSIIFHLAGNPEYNQCRVPTYCADVDEYFAPFKDDEAITLTRELNEKRGINYDAVMSFAIHVKDTQSMAERIPFDSPSSRLEKRWNAADARRFLASLHRFVVRSKFQQFVDAHATLYDNTGARMRSLVESQADLAWFDKFFGAKPNARFIVIPALLNGGANYALACRPRTDAKRCTPSSACGG